MAFLTKVPVFDVEDLPGLVTMVPVYDEEHEVLDLMRHGNKAVGMAVVNAAILCYRDEKDAYRGEMRQQGETIAVCDVDSFDAFAKWLRAYSHNCKG